MNIKLYKDLDDFVYNSIKKIEEYDKQRYIIFSNRRKNLIIEELDKIKDVNNIRLLKYLIKFSLDKDFDIASKALSHLKNIIDSLSMKEFLFLAEFFRSYLDSYFTYYYGGKIIDELERKYFEIKKFKLNLIERFDDDKKYILAILTMYSNGYVREDALKELAKIDDGFKLKYIMVRINDWVLEVRNVAKNELINNIKIKYLKDFVDSLLIIRRIEFWSRDNHEDVLRFIKDFILDENKYDILFDCFKHTKDFFVKRELFNYLLNIKSDPKLILDYGIKSNDVLIVNNAVKKIKEIINDDNKNEIFNLLKESKNKFCRIKAIDILEDLNKDTKDYIPFLFDSSCGIRDYCRFKLRKKEVFDFRKIYLEELEKNNYKLACILSGLKDVGLKEDSKIFKNYIDYKNMKIKRIALFGMFSLNDEEDKRYLMKFLVSDDKIESNIAKKIIIKNNIRLDFEFVYEAFKDRNYEEYVYSNLIILINSYSKWSMMEFLFKLLDIIDDKYISLVNQKLENLILNFNNSFLKPKENELQNIIYLFKKINKKLDTKNKSYIDSILKLI